MQTRPDHPTLLDAITRFLLEELSPKLAQDKALQFRALIAANLTGIVAGEMRTEDARRTAEATRLAALLGGAPAGDLESLNQTLTARLRAGTIDERAALEHLLHTARETLTVTNPRFDLSDEISE